MLGRGVAVSSWIELAPWSSFQGLSPNVERLCHVELGGLVHAGASFEPKCPKLSRHELHVAVLGSPSKPRFIGSGLLFQR